MNINRFANNLDETPLHSSGYAEVARKNKIGTYSPQSFTQRLHVERNRSAVGGYHHSMLANGHHRNNQYQRVDVVTGRPSSEQPVSRSSTEPTIVSRQSGRVISDVMRPAVRQNFSEPPARGYNPYK